MPKMLRPADYCREDWKCLVCGAPKEKLSRSEDFWMEWVRCEGCGFMYKLKIPLTDSKKRYVPRPARNKRWRDVWYRAWLHFIDTNEIWKFMSQFPTPAQANNAMNRLDGGGMIARERTSRK